MNSIRIRLATILTVILLVVCSALGFVAYQSSVQALEDTTEDILSKMVLESSKVVSERILSRMNEISVMANTELIQRTDASPEDKLAYLKGELQRGGYLSFGVGNAEGEVMTMAGAVINLKERPYYQEALQGESASSRARSSARKTIRR